MTPQDHNKALGISHLAYGGFHLLVLSFISFFFFVVAANSRGFRGDESFFTIMMLFMIAVGLIFSLPSLIAGYALLKRKTWARTAAIVAGILATPSFPYGTALGVYTLWFLFGNEGKDFYANLASWSSYQPGALPGAGVGGNWAADAQRKEREREYAPPPRMPDWR
jgi:hypothetical protein